MSQQQPHQPGWATPPQQPAWGTPPPQPPKKRSVGKVVGLGCLGVVGLFFVLGAIGAVLDNGKATNASSSASPSPTRAGTTPSGAATTTASAKAAAPAKPVTGAPAKKLPTAEARKKAAAILEKEDQDFRDFLAEGEPKIGTPQYTAWYDKAVVGLDMKQTAFSKADAYFTADNEPTDLLEQWRADNGDANAAITQFGSDGLSPDAPDAATRKDKADCLAALAKADKDAEKIANGG